MQTERTLFEDLKYQFQHGGMTMKLIFINVIVFLFISVLSVLGELFQGLIEEILISINHTIFALNTDFTGFMFTPWGLFTSIFAHFSFFHILMNMLMLYFSGKMFEQLFNQNRLLYTYILGGIAGGLFEIIAHAIFPIFQSSNVIVVGASGSIMAIFMALAFYRPNLQVMFFGLFPVKIILLAGVFLAIDLFSLASNDGTAHFAHIGGAIIGIISIKNIHSQGNIIHVFQKLSESILSFFQKIFGKREPKFTVKKGGTARGNVKTDEEYNYEAKQRQKHIDEILDKIAKSGYESLSKAEKEFLFNQSQNGK